MSPIKNSLIAKSVFNYAKHIDLLKDYYDLFKEKNSHFSHRFITSKLKLKSSAIFLHVVNGKIKLTDIHIKKFCQIFELDHKEAEYFNLLVHINQSNHAIEKIFYLNSIIMFIKSNSDLFANNQRCSFIEWYYLPFFLLSSHKYYDFIKNEILVYVINVLSGSSLVQKNQELNSLIQQVKFERLS